MIKTILANRGSWNSYEKVKNVSIYGTKYESGITFLVSFQRTTATKQVFLVKICSLCC